MKSPYEFLCAMLLRNELEKKGAFSKLISHNEMHSSITSVQLCQLLQILSLISGCCLQRALQLDGIQLILSVALLLAP